MGQRLTRDAVASIRQSLPVLGVILWLPLVLAVVGAIIYRGLDQADWVFAVQLVFLSVLVGLSSVKWHRYQILREAPAKLAVSIGGSMWCYSWRWLVFWVVAMVPAFFFFGAYVTASGGDILTISSQGMNWTVLGLWFVSFSVAAYLVLRFALTLPSIAVRYEKIKLRDSFRRTGVLGGDIVVAALFVGALQTSIEVGVDYAVFVTDSAWVVETAWRIVATMVTLVVEASLLTEIYRRVGPA